MLHSTFNAPFSYYSYHLFFYLFFFFCFFPYLALLDLLLFFIWKMFLLKIYLNSNNRSIRLMAYTNVFLPFSLFFHSPNTGTSCENRFSCIPFTYKCNRHFTRNIFNRCHNPPVRRKSHRLRSYEVSWVRMFFVIQFIFQFDLHSLEENWMWSTFQWKTTVRGYDEREAFPKCVSAKMEAHWGKYSNFFENRKTFLSNFSHWVILLPVRWSIRFHSVFPLSAFLTFTHPYCVCDVFFGFLTPFAEIYPKTYWIHIVGFIQRTQLSMHLWRNRDWKCLFQV